MNRQAIQTRYLLGKLSDAESASLEERSFVDDNVFDEIEIAEDELIDAYVGGSLSAEDRERFENKLLKSGRIAERVEFARLLSESRSPQVMVQEPAKTSWWSGFFDISFGANPALTSAAATALLLVVLGLPVFVWMRMRFEGRLNLERSALEQQRLAIEQKLANQQAQTNKSETNLQNAIAEAELLQQQLKETQEQVAALERRAQNNRQSLLPASISLYPRSLRGPGEVPLLRVSRTARTIQLRLVLDTEEDYDEYIAKIISSVDDDVLDRDLKTTRRGRSGTIIFTFPAKDLPPGKYSVRVTGRRPSGTYDPVGEYSVEVEKK